MRTRENPTILLGEAEWKVMRCMWAGGPRNGREVLDALRGETRWAYTTAKTLLDRLVEKGALACEMRGNTAFYRTRVTRESCRRSALRSLLDRAFDGAFGPLLHHLVEEEKLTKKDRETLRRMLGDDARPRRRR